MRHHSTWAAILAAAILLGGAFAGFGQIDPEHRNLLEIGYDQPLVSQGPQGAYIYYYYNNPEIHGTNTALRLAIAPVYFNGEIGFKGLISPTTDVGLGIEGGAYNDDYFEVRQGKYITGESFIGYGGGASVSVYQLFNPGMLIPLNAVVRGGFHYSSYDPFGDTDKNFVVPENRMTYYTRVGLRLAGKEPVLYPDLGMELSVWFERDWRNGTQSYGFNGDRDVSAYTDLYWVYGEMSYAWTNTGQKASFTCTAGGTENADRFSAYRLGGVLPLIAEFPLEIPGYYYEELTATRYLNMYASYQFPLIPSHDLEFRFEAGTANLNYLSGFQQGAWQSGAGGGLTFTPRSRDFRIELRYGYGFNALRNGNDHQGGQSVGLLFQYDFEQWHNNRQHD